MTPRNPAPGVTIPSNASALNVDVIQVSVLAKSQKPGFSPNIIICYNMKAKMMIFMAQPLFF